jgi:hypothetical protein
LITYGFAHKQISLIVYEYWVLKTFPKSSVRICARVRGEAVDYPLL